MRAVGGGQRGVEPAQGEIDLGERVPGLERVGRGGGRLAELGEPWAPVEIKDIHDPLGVAISNLWMLGWVRLAVAYDDAGKAYTICQPAGHAQDDKPLLN